MNLSGLGTGRCGVCHAGIARTEAFCSAQCETVAVDTISAREISLVAPCAYCHGSGVVLAEGACDAAPAEAPCGCLDPVRRDLEVLADCLTPPDESREEQ